MKSGKDRDHLVTANTSQTRPENRAFYPALDGLRAIAFMMVFLLHYLQMPWGWTGVEIFFVLSGFLITGILYDTRQDAHCWRNFYIRRTLRIFPLYYGVLFGLLLLYPIAKWQLSWYWLAWPLYLGNWLGLLHPVKGSPAWLAEFGGVTGHLRGNVLRVGHFWSLCVEEQFYLFWPSVVFFVRDRRRLMWICAAALPVCLVIRVAFVHLRPDLIDYEVPAWLTIARVDEMLAGGLVALALRGPAAELWKRVARCMFPVVFAAAMVGVFLSPLKWGDWYQHPFPLFVLTWAPTVTEILGALLILNLVDDRWFLARPFRFKPLRWLGRISYGLYVFHDIPHDFYARAGARLRFLQQDEATALVAAVCTVAIAWLSFRFFESPFLNLKERWTARR